jgi:hypothetical protein
MFNKSRVLLLRIISEGKPIYNFRITMQAIVWKTVGIIIQFSTDCHDCSIREKRWVTTSPLAINATPPLFLVLPKAGVALEGAFFRNPTEKSFCIAYSRFNTKFFIVSLIKIGDRHGYSQMDSGIYSSPSRCNEQGGWYHHADGASYPAWLAAGCGFSDFHDTAGEAPGCCLTLRQKTLY